MDLDLYIALRNIGVPEDNAKAFIYATHEKIDSRFPKRSNNLIRDQDSPTSQLLKQDLLLAKRNLETAICKSKIELILWTLASAVLSVALAIWFTVNQ